MNTRLANMLKEGIIPHRDGVWIDCYNQSVSDIAGTILAGITDKNHYFVTMETQILTHMRTEEGKELRRHGIDSRNNDVLTPRQDGTSNTLTSFYKDNLVAEPTECNVIGTLPSSIEMSGRVYSTNGVAPTCSTCQGGDRETKIAEPINARKLRIRKLTERECFRLMDVPDSYIDKMQGAGISRHQQYKLAGNSIVVNCMFLIFKNLFIGCEEQPQQLTLF